MKRAVVASCLAVLLLVLGILPLAGISRGEAAKGEKQKAENPKSEQAKKGTWQPELRIGLLSGQSSVTFHVSVPSVLEASDTQKRIVFFSPGKTMKITVQNGQLAVDGKRVPDGKIQLRPQQKRPLTEMQIVINGKTYAGGAEVQLRGGKLTVSNLVAVEDYLRGVLPAEMPYDWPEEALKAQAVAARTYAMKHRGKHEEDGYDLCASTHCQVYDGIASDKPKTNAAIRATHGEALTYKGKLIEAFFHTDSGGMTESCLEVWGTNMPYLVAADEVQKGTMPWEVSYSLADFSSKLAKSGHGVGTVKQVKLSKLHVGKGASDRSPSGRVRQLRVTGSKGTKTITGNELRSLLGLKSTLFDVHVAGGKVTISGYGWGHGIGLSQWGAKAFAAKLPYDKILAHYYKGTVLKKLY